MKVHLLSGFLGSGKTTAIQQAAALFIAQGIRVGLITNDQGVKLVDANLFTSLNIPSRQVTNGCFCCNFNELDSNIDSLLAKTNPEVIFAESVGSCTDIVATVMKPLLRHRPGTDITLSTFADARLLYMLLRGNRVSFDPAVTYIYKKQLEEAGIIVVSKIDLMNDADLNDLSTIFTKNYTTKIVIYQNSFDEISLRQWLNLLDDPATNTKLQSLQIDYDIYGQGEAMLAWLDQEIEIYSPSNAARNEAFQLADLIHKKIREQNYSIGHLKFLIDGKIKLSFTLTSGDERRTYTNHSSKSAAVLINARVQTSPEELSKIVTEAIKEVSDRSGCSIVVTSVAAFKPGYPTPTHRL